MKTRDMLGCAASAAFFLLAAAWNPFVGAFLSLLTPLPFLYYSTKLGFKQGVKLTALVVLTISLAAKLAGQPQIILLAVELGLFGLALSELLKRKLSIGWTIFLGAVFMLIVGFAVLFFWTLVKNVEPLDLILGSFKEHLKAAFKVYQEMGIPQEKAAELEQVRKAVIETISRLYPSLVIVGTGFAVWLNIVLAKPLFRMKNLEYPEFVPLDRWQAPDALVWGVIVSGFALFLLPGGIRLFLVNALVVMMAIYFFHGLSITLFFLNKYRVTSLIRVAVYLLIMIQQLFIAALALAGLFDQWVDFRKIHRRKDT